MCYVYMYPPAVRGVLDSGRLVKGPSGMTATKAGVSKAAKFHEMSNWDNVLKM